tara:strand:+ start:13259 stop:14317 length:1059 start_codon:yes stop_codon:yes gene_type:complete
MKTIDIFNLEVNHNLVRKPLIIAEAGVNHEGDMENAKRLIDEASEASADAIKFQTYKAETIASKDSPSYWDRSEEPTESQYKLFKKYDKFWKKEFEELKLHCDKAGIDFMSTPFDIDSALFLNDLMDVYKISSSDITNKPFIEYIADFGKPIILSTGASNTDEIDRAVKWIKKKNVDLAILHCILNYPTKDENANLGMMKDLQARYPDNLIGLSDHTLPKKMKTLEMATLMGASIIEKHFTHDKTLIGNDHYHAMDKKDLEIFNSSIENILKLVGSHNKKALNSEEPARKNARRSLVASKDIKKGQKISHSELTWKRPAHGISPSDINKVIDMIASVNIAEDSILQWNMFEK